MEITDFNKKLKSGEIEIVKQEDTTSSDPTQQKDQQNKSDLPFNAQDYIAILQVLQVVKTALTSAPTFTPKSFAESIQFYDSGGVRRLYLYVAGTWRYVVLT